MEVARILKAAVALVDRMRVNSIELTQYASATLISVWLYIPQAPEGTSKCVF